MADDPKKSEVGYKKPPKEKQFRKGVSGNPQGRPKRSQTLNSLMREVGEKPVSMTEGDRTKVISLKKAIVNQLGNGAARGDYRYLALYLKLLTQLESAEEANGATQELDELDTATLRGAVRRLRSVDIDSLLDPDTTESEADAPEFDAEANETSDAPDTEPPNQEGN